MQTYGHTGAFVGRAETCAMARSVNERKLPLLDKLSQHWGEQREQAAAKRGMKMSGCKHIVGSQFSGILLVILPKDAARRGTLQRTPLMTADKPRPRQSAWQTEPIIPEFEL